jgi:hypothetical protein
MCALMRNTVTVERDELRLQLTGKYWTGDLEVEEEVTRLQEALVRGYLASRFVVIISDTHLPDRSVKKWLKLGHELGVPVRVQDFRDVPLETVLLHNAERGKWSNKVVPEEAIKDKYNRFVKGRDLTKEVTYTPSEPFVPKEYLQPLVGDRAYLFDVDGTLAICGDRDIYDGSKAHLDTEFQDVTQLMFDLWDHVGAKAIVMTGRSEEHRVVTENWLKSKGLVYDALYCRPAGDTRPDNIVKHELFWQHVAPKGYKISGVFDDRDSVVKLWRDMGLTCFQVNYGNF